MSDKSLMKQLQESKLKAFSVGTMGKRQMSKKEMEEQKKKDEEKAAAQVFEEFVATFQEAPAKSGKVWVKAGTYDAGKRQEDTREKGKLYKPTSRISEFIERDKFVATSKLGVDSPKAEKAAAKKKEKEKKKSNLELFKEELKLIQEEREERHKYKGIVKVKHEHSEPPPALSVASKSDDSRFGSYDTGDPTTTNLYLGNLNPKITEQQLMEIFGKYGPLASIKIMWPRSDEEKARGRNCGFVAFMNRKDGERALRTLNGKEVVSYEMKLGWGKAIPIPAHPIYIPPKMLELTLPPPPSGLPFNAQPSKSHLHKVPPPSTPFPTDPEELKEFNKILAQAVVKVVIPTERNLLALIHRMIEFVVREGPMFEAMIMNKEINNPMYRFLFENQSPANAYYRWKLYSVLQGDSPQKWKTEEFYMFKGGSIWKPPPMNPYTQGMPDDLISDDELEPTKGRLPDEERDVLEGLIHTITPERSKICKVMFYCIDHAESADEICSCIAESLALPQTPLFKKIARLYLISDILHNCSVKITNASFYRQGFQSRLPDIFKEIHQTYKNIEGRMKAEAFKLRVMNCFRAWEDWAVYPQEFLIRLQNIFLGLSPTTAVVNTEEMQSSPVRTSRKQQLPKDTEDIDGHPVEDLDGAPLLDSEDLDGIPLDGAALKKAAAAARRIAGLHDDLDGIPLGHDDSWKGMSSLMGKNLPPGFAPSKWETVNPEDVQAQAVTTSKWDLLDQDSDEDDSRSGPHTQSREPDEDIDGIPFEEDSGSQQNSEHLRDGDRGDSDDLAFENREMTEERRAKLREIELKVMTYQDELESGSRSFKHGYSMHEQLEHYRRKLLRKAERSERERECERELDKERDKERLDRDRNRDRGRGREREPSRELDRNSRREGDRSRHSSSPDDPYYRDSHRSARSRSRSPHNKTKSKRSLSTSESTPPSKRAYNRSRSRSPKRSARRSRSRSRSPMRGRSRSRSPFARKHKHKHKH